MTQQAIEMNAYKLSMGLGKLKFHKINNVNVIKQLVHGERASVKLWIHLEVAKHSRCG